MDEIQEFKNFLGLAAKGYSASHLRQLRREMHTMAELWLDIYLYKKSQRVSRNAQEDFDQLWATA